MEPQSSFVISTAIRLPDIITWVCIIFGGGGAFAWLKITLTRHNSVLFDGSGETRLVSKESLALSQDLCAKGRLADHQHLTTEITRIDIWNGQQVLALSTSIEKLSDKMDKMSTSITVLSVGGKPKVNSMEDTNGNF